MTAMGDHAPDLRPDSEDRIQISSLDVTRACFNAKINKNDPPTHVDLPPEDPDSGTKCALLLRHMYGTGAAADGLHQECSSMLISLGFVQCSGNPNEFYQK